MTSANFRTIPIDQISIDRASRQRREIKPDALQELADSIAQVGLINPPVIDPNYNLVAGERRLTACRDILGWSAIPVQLTDDLEPDQLYLIELEENAKRQDLEWKDECFAIEEYHRLRARDPEWTTADTASALGIGQRTVQHKLGVAQALHDGHPLISSADKYSVARGLLERANQRKSQDLTSALSATAPAPVSSPTGAQGPEVSRAQDRAESGAEATTAAGLSSGLTPAVSPVPANSPPIQNIEFADWTESPTLRPNFIHCDFPYGINADRHNGGAADKFGGYADSEDVYWSLMSDLADFMPHVAPSAHLMFWFSMDYYQRTIDALTDMGWTVNHFPLIWFRSDNSGILPDPKRGPRRVYETCLMASRGDRFIVQAVSNHIFGKNEKEFHMSQKPLGVLRHFMRMFVDDSTIMLDPTCGSGSAVIAAKQRGASQVLGLERDPEFTSRAHDHWNSIDFDKEIV